MHPAGDRATPRHPRLPEVSSLALCIGSKAPCLAGVRRLIATGRCMLTGPFYDAGSYTFHSFEAWTHPGLHPPPPEALKLLHRLAADRGIAAVMAQHRQVDSLWGLQDCIFL